MPQVKSEPAPPLSDATKARLDALEAAQKPAAAPPPAVADAPKKRGRPSNADLAARKLAAEGTKHTPPKNPAAAVAPEGMDPAAFAIERSEFKEQMWGVLHLRGEPYVRDLVVKYAGVNKFSFIPYESWGAMLEEAVAPNPNLPKHPEAIHESELLAAIPEGKKRYEPAPTGAP